MFPAFATKYTLTGSYNRAKSSAPRTSASGASAIRHSPSTSVSRNCASSRVASRFVVRAPVAETFETTGTVTATPFPSRS